MTLSVSTNSHHFVPPGQNSRFGPFNLCTRGTHHRPRSPLHSTRLVMYQHGRPPLTSHSMGRTPSNLRTPDTPDDWHQLSPCGKVAHIATQDQAKLRTVDNLFQHWYLTGPRHHHAMLSSRLNILFCNNSLYHPWIWPGTYLPFKTLSWYSSTPSSFTHYPLGQPNFSPMHQSFQQTSTTTWHLTRMSHPPPPSTPSTQYHTSSRTYLWPGPIDQSIVDLVRHAPRPFHE